MATWRIALDDVAVERQREASGDRPYFPTIYFRTRMGRPGSSVVELHCGEPHDWVGKREYNPVIAAGGRDHMVAGQRLSIPWWMGQHEWRGVEVRPPSAADVRFEIFGAIVLCFDNNNTPPHFVHDKLNQLVAQLKTLLQETIEFAFRPPVSTPQLTRQGGLLWGIPLDLFQDPSRLIPELQRRLLDVATKIGVSFTFADKVDWAFGSTFNPDRPVGFQAFVFPAITGVPLQRFVLTGGSVLFGSPPPSLRREGLVFAGEGGRYVVSTRIQPDSATSDLRFNSLVVQVKTGGDNLRSGEGAAAYVSMRGAPERTVLLNRGAEWGNWSDARVDWLVGSFRVGDVRSFGIRTAFGGGWNGENWDVSAVKVSAGNGSGTPLIPLLVQHGIPLVRFSGDRHVWELPF